MNWLSEIWTRIWDPVATSAGAIGMLVCAHLIRRFRERMVTLRWSARHQSIAVSTHDATFGKIEVLYNNNPVQNLSMCFLEIENESTRDLTDLTFSASYSDGTQFLVSMAALRGATALLFSSPFAHALTTWRSLMDPQKSQTLDYISKNREYHIPVLNRGAKVDFAALVMTKTGIQPTVQVICVHRGVRVRQKPPQLVMFGVNQNHAVGVGFVIGIIVIGLLQIVGLIEFWPIFLSFLAGTLVLAIGALAIHFVRLLVRVLG